MNDYLKHHGILGQKWGKTNGPPYPLDRSQMSRAEIRRLDRADKKFSKKVDKRVRTALEKSVANEMREYDRQLRQNYKVRTTRGKEGKNYATAYSKKLAELMNTKISQIEDFRSPSGMVVRFVAKRGEKGVFTALATPNYDFNQLKSGVYSSGKVAYRKQTVDMDKYD